jgi:hypothetical protein
VSDRRRACRPPTIADPSGLVEAPRLVSLVGHGIMAGALGIIANDLIVRGKLCVFGSISGIGWGGGRQD